ncbi:hypothetical protein NDU88_007152 [Pleurodeles waltl]|uniref:Uncharacterized protein n=1 Tax=Pleurodeles waltl TaxID=8319 RepID=A0AAV7QM48_PLEWA|nr:hypothetical protein NDU88_007152 [Pleurodeles waltl]
MERVRLALECAEAGIIDPEEVFRVRMLQLLLLLGRYEEALLLDTADTVYDVRRDVRRRRKPADRQHLAHQLYQAIEAIANEEGNPCLPGREGTSRHQSNKPGTGLDTPEEMEC